jgi:hypothetical protein
VRRFSSGLDFVTPDVLGDALRGMVRQVEQGGVRRQVRFQQEVPRVARLRGLLPSA